MTYFAKISQNHRGQSFKIINQVFNAIKETKILSKELFFTDQFVIEKNFWAKQIFILVHF